VGRAYYGMPRKSQPVSSRNGIKRAHARPCRRQSAGQILPLSASRMIGQAART
jgi:hypothetical protein